MVKSRQTMLTRQQSNMTMRSAVDINDFNNEMGGNDFIEDAKQTRFGGIGSKINKSRNHKESAKANKARAKKFNRAIEIEEEYEREQQQAEEDAYFAPVDKKDAKNMAKQQGKQLKQKKKR